MYELVANCLEQLSKNGEVTIDDQYSMVLVDTDNGKLFGMRDLARNVIFICDPSLAWLQGMIEHKMTDKAKEDLKLSRMFN